MKLLRKVICLNLGITKYSPCMELMNKIAQKKLDSLNSDKHHSHIEINDCTKTLSYDALIITEHFPVYTIGVREANYAEESYEQRLKNLGAEFVKTDRGGLITFHGPGQLICYPVLDLRNYKMRTREYVELLQKVLLKVINRFSIFASVNENIGIWCGNNKIASIGIHCRKGITTHGISVNCNNDLSWFNHIVACGLEGKGVTSISNETKKKIDTQIVSQIFKEEFSLAFNVEFEEGRNV